MKLTKLKEIVENMDKINETWANAQKATSENPGNTELQRKAGLASAQRTRAYKTLKNYGPVFSVTLGQFCDCAQEVYDAMGKEIQMHCYDFHTNAEGKAQADLFLVVGKGENANRYNLCKIVLDDENQPLRDVKINLLNKGLIKGLIQMKRLEEISDTINIISWNAITKTILQSIEEKKKEKQAKQIVGDFKKSFSSMTYEEREAYLKENGFDFGTPEQASRP